MNASHELQAIEGKGQHPSKVEVPRPSSSRMTRESRLACCRMVAASVHSTRKVLSPDRMRSCAPAHNRGQSQQMMLVDC